MKTDLFSVSKIFTERLLRIPDYQRGYAWGERQLKDYWSDLVNLEDGKNHYIGVLTLEDVPSEVVDQWEDDHWIVRSKSYEPFYVVDGQQRLTTTIILIQAITEVVPDDTPINFTSVSDIRKKFLFDSKDGGVSRSYIFGYEKDNPSYEFLKVRILNESSDSSYPIQETIYTHNLDYAKRFFLDKIQELSIDEIENLYQKLTQRFLFNIYAISNDVDVFVAFETMNNRGKPLSHLELLKNRLIYISTKFDVEPYERASLRKTINESWKTIYHHLGRNKLNPLDDDLFLENHFLLYFGDVLDDGNDSPFKMRRLRRGYRHYHKDYLLEEKFTTKNIGANVPQEKALSITDIKRYSKSLKDSVEIWYQILNPDESNFSPDVIDWLKKLNRVGISTALPLIMVFFQNEGSKHKRVELLSLIEALIFFMTVVRYHYYIEVDNLIFLEYASRLSRKDIDADSLVSELRDHVDRIRKDKRVISNVKYQFKRNGFYSWGGIKYFLYEYEMYLRSRSKSSRYKINWSEFIEESEDYHTIEHIYPQNPRKKCWTEKYRNFSTKEKSTLRHSLGNLVPLSKPKNSSFQNNCFENKLGSESNQVGFRYGSYSENEIACYSDWTANDILDRGVKLLTFMENRWGLSLGDKSEKVKFLGLEFVAKKQRRQALSKTKSS